MTAVCVRWQDQTPEVGVQMHEWWGTGGGSIWQASLRKGSQTLGQPRNIPKAMLGGQCRQNGWSGALVNFPQPRYNTLNGVTQGIHVFVSLQEEWLVEHAAEGLVSTWLWLCQQPWGWSRGTTATSTMQLWNHPQPAQLPPHTGAHLPVHVYLQPHLHKYTVSVT